MNKTHILLLATALLLAACQSAPPEHYTEETQSAPVSPSNDGATLPPNIAPLNLTTTGAGSDAYVHAYSKADPEGLVCHGTTTDWDLDDWHKLVQSAKGDTLFTDIFIAKDGQWHKYPTLRNPVAREETDPYITYRLLRPTYIDYGQMTIWQRDITNFDEQLIVDNMSLPDGSRGLCLNCHVPQE
jgi:hypothetical protein